jgi:hypothetical protein
MTGYMIQLSVVVNHTTVTNRQTSYFYSYVSIERDTESLMMSIGYSEAVNRRWTDNTMVKRKRTKGQTTIHKTLAY